MRRFVLLALLAITCSLRAQELYVLAVCTWPINDSPPYGRDCRPTPVTLSTIDTFNKSLHTVRSFVPHGQTIDSVASSNQVRRVAIASPALEPVDVDVLNMDDPSAPLQTLHFSFDGFLGFRGYFMHSAEQQDFFAMEMVNSDFAQPGPEKPFREITEGIDLNTQERKQLPWESFVNVVDSGTGSRGIQNSVQVSIYSDGAIGLPRVDGGPDLASPWRITPSLRRPEMRSANVEISTREMLVLRLTGANFLILDKTKGTWRPLSIPYWDTTRVKAFGPWLAIELERKRKLIKRGPVYFYVTLPLGPGLAVRKKASRQLGYFGRAGDAWDSAANSMIRWPMTAGIGLAPCYSTTFAPPDNTK